MKKIFRNVYIGGIAKTELLQKFKENSIGLNEFALNIIQDKKFTVLPYRKKVQTVEVSLKDLGFTTAATTLEIWQKAYDFGFTLTPDELALHMRLQYRDFNQPIDPPKGYWQNIAIRKFYEDNEFDFGFYLRRRSDGFWLRGYRTSPDYLWDLVDRFIFAKE